MKLFAPTYVVVAASARWICTALRSLSALLIMALPTAAEDDVRIGIIGCDTSHATAFAEIFNDPANTGDLAAVRVVAAYPEASDDIPASTSRVAEYTQQLKARNIEIVDSIEALVARVDAVLVESVDGRKHLPQARQVIAAHKPVFIDKPMSASLADAITIFRLADESKVACFSSSALRFCPDLVELSFGGEVGDILGCDAFSPCEIEPHHPDLFWYGVHGVEILFTVMGPGCRSVSQTRTDDTHVVVGVWKDGRIGTFRGSRRGPHDYGTTVFGTKTIVNCGKFAGYRPLVEQIGKFFRTRQPPVAAAETLEILAFMEAAEQSGRSGGKSVALKEMFERATTAAAPPK